MVAALSCPLNGAGVPGPGFVVGFRSSCGASSCMLHPVPTKQIPRVKAAKIVFLTGILLLVRVVRRLRVFFDFLVDSVVKDMIVGF